MLTCIAYSARQTPLRQTREMAEGVKIPEKNACFWRFGPPIGGRGEANPGQPGHANYSSGGPLANRLANGPAFKNSFENRHLHRLLPSVGPLARLRGGHHFREGDWLRRIAILK